MPHSPYSLSDEPVRVVLVLTVPPSERELEDEREAEMRSLLKTANREVVAVARQHLARPVGSTYIGKGKVEDVRQLALSKQAEEVVFDALLTPSQERNLEKALEILVVDYAALILHIFAQNARTHQAMLAVELAQLEHNRSRLKRLWTHLDRIKAGMNMRGPGEKQLETDRRLINDHIRELRRKLHVIEQRKERAVASRRDCFKVCLVGYTNAGKSSLLNALTDAQVLAEDKLFATLDTRTTRIELPTHHTVVMSDTVGFIRNLPPTLVASFHATLAEVIEADLLLHVVDTSLPNMEEQVRSVEEVLHQIGAEHIPSVMVFNKIDRSHSKTILLAFKRRYPGSVAVSAHSGEGLEQLKQAIVTAAERGVHRVTVRYSVIDGRADAFVRRSCAILDEHYEGEEAVLSVEADARLVGEMEANPALTIDRAEPTGA
ncbi:MAG: GTPase HflX [Planctomycetota bacterium]